MPRRARIAPGGMVYHALNRGNGRNELVHEPEGRLNGEEGSLPSAWPIDVPADWVGRVNRAQSAAELEALRHSVNRGTPYGSDAWQMRMAKKLRLEFTLRPRGRPRKETR